MDLVHARSQDGPAVCPVGNPAPDFATGAREGENLFTDSVVVLDAKTGDYKNNFKLVKKDWHDWDVSNPPTLIQTQGGKQLMAVAPKDGYSMASISPPTPALPRAGDANRECRGHLRGRQGGPFLSRFPGGGEWNTPAYDPQTNLIITGKVDWCNTVTIQTEKTTSGDCSRPAMDRQWRRATL